MTVKVMIEKESLEKKLGQISNREKIFWIITGYLGTLVAIFLGLFLIYNGLSTTVESIEVDPHPIQLKEEQPVTSVPQETFPKGNESEWITLTYMYDWGDVKNVTLPSKSLVSDLIEHIKKDPKQLNKDFFLLLVRNWFNPSGKGEVFRINPNKPLDYYSIQKTDCIAIISILPSEEKKAGVVE